MKKSGLFLVGWMLFSLSCGKDDPPPITIHTRYKEAVYVNVTSITDITYGSNVTANGANKTLKLDFYSPANDTAVSRPLLILLPGGGFGPATDKQAYLVPEAEAIAKYGYVVACMNYRTYDGSQIPMSGNTLKLAILQGMQDAKAAIRFFRDDADHANIYQINPNKIFIAGHSAGGFVALHTVYLDELAKADADFQLIIQSNGGLEGNSGHPGYSSAVNGVINIAGALLDKNYITANGKPLKNIYGDQDTVVPFGDGLLNSEPRIAPILVSGGNALNTRAASVGVVSSAYVLSGGDHIEPALPQCAGCLLAISDFMYKLL